MSENKDRMVTPDKARVAELREVIGLLPAVKEARARAVMQAIDDAASLNDIKRILRTMIEHKL